MFFDQVRIIVFCAQIALVRGAPTFGSSSRVAVAVAEIVDRARTPSVRKFFFGDVSFKRSESPVPEALENVLRIARHGDQQPYHHDQHPQQHPQQQQQQQRQQQQQEVVESVRERAMRLFLPGWFAEKDFSPEQRRRLEDELRQRLYHESPETSTPWWYDDPVTLCRFAEARDWDVDAASDMLRKHFAWRRESGLEELVRDPVRGGLAPRFSLAFRVDPGRLYALRELYPSSFHRTDRWGRPVRYDVVGRFRAADAVRAAGGRRVLRDLFVWHQEASLLYRLPAASLAAGRLLTETVYVVDAAGMRPEHFGAEARAILREIAAVGSDHYPQTMAAIYVVNAPVLVRAIMAFLSPLLPKRVKESVTILGGRDKYLPILLSLIREEDLPTFLGGRDDTFDPHREQGPWVGLLPDLAAA